MYELEVIESELEREGDVVGLLSVEEAVSFYRSLRKSARGSASSFVECGDALRSFDMVEEALGCYGDAIIRDAGYLPGYLGRGELLFELAVCGASEEEIVRHAMSAVSDFRVAMMLSLGSSDVVWRLGTALLVISDVAGTRGLAENVLVKTQTSMLYAKLVRVKTICGHKISL